MARLDRLKILNLNYARAALVTALGDIAVAQEQDLHDEVRIALHHVSSRIHWLEETYRIKTEHETGERL